MSLEKEIQDAFKMLSQRDIDTFAVKVTKVDKANGTCSVFDDLNNLEYSDVRLSAVIDGNDKKHYLFPKVGSQVLISPINEDINQLYVDVYSELESYQLKIESTSFLITQKGFEITRNQKNLKDNLLDLMTQVSNLCDSVNQIVVNSGAGVGPNIPQITQIKTQIETQIKQGLNDILI